MTDLIAVNLNERVRVKLTDYGKDIYYHQFDELNREAGKQVIKPRFPKEDENGYASFQLWDFMNIYGKYMILGAPEVIKPLEIVLTEWGRQENEDIGEGDK